MRRGRWAAADDVDVELKLNEPMDSYPDFIGEMERGERVLTDSDRSEDRLAAEGRRVDMAPEARKAQGLLERVQRAASVVGSVVGELDDAETTVEPGQGAGWSKFAMELERSAEHLRKLLDALDVVAGEIERKARKAG
jgi:hypothetical protein